MIINDNKNLHAVFHFLKITIKVLVLPIFCIAKQPVVMSPRH